MTDAQKIRELIRKIAGGESVGAFTAEVVSVEGDTCTVEVNGLQIPEVRLNAVSNDSTNKLIITPVVGSVVGIVDMGGENRDLTVFQFTEIDSIVWNGGSLGGLTKTKELKTQLAKLTTRVDGIISAIEDGVVVAEDGGASFKTTMVSALEKLTDKEDFSNIEDDTFKH